MSNNVDSASLKFIVVDDNDLVLHQVRAVLQKAGVTNIELVNSGQAAINRLNNNNGVDVFLLDLNMPGIDGIEVMRHLALNKYSGALVLISGEDIRILKTAESLASAHSLNLVATLSKPLSFKAINQVLQQIKPCAESVRQAPFKSFNSITPELLKAAIQKKDICPFFQPKVRADNKQIVSVEVLARWLHTQNGIIPPIAFIPLAEEFNLISSLTISIFEQSVSLFSDWLNKGYEFSLAVNITARELENVNLPETLADLANAKQVPCNLITLEITESQLVENLTKSLDVLARLRLKGFGLSIDDFGTGYSTMEQLYQAPFTELKIDRAFVHEVYCDREAHAILESSANLAKKLDLVIVAEGVEDQRDWDIAVNAGCNLIQGYFVAKPLDAEQFERWLIGQKLEVTSYDGDGGPVVNYSAAKESIIVADDNVDNLAVIEKILCNWGYDVRIALNGLEALAMVTEQKPDLILLDIHMPELDGYDTCKRLKQQESTRDIPVIFVTAMNEEFNRIKGFEVGAVDYVTKPLSIPELQARVSVHLELSERNKALLKKNIELEKFNKAMVDREMRIIELKKEINELVQRLGEEARYKLHI
ncbi:EAL domain-containing protein [Psychromonas aquimarina]|uniref:EAL domain-containing protein n=1 Tax=Psychromonas aquimarina TaxID=444919 RepID=UPI0004061768|nr:EAL domain-containing protein [Psychromonas aquimarina]